MSWRYGRTEAIEGVPPEATEAIEALQQSVDGFEYVIELDRDGDFNALRNWEEVRDKSLALLDKLVPQTASPAERSAAAQMKAVFVTREAVSNFMLREVRLFFMLYGWRLDVGESTSYDEQLPNPLGGPPLPAKATVKAVSADKATAVLRYSLEFDRNLAGKVLADSLAALAKRSNKPAHELETIAATFDVRDEAVLTFDQQLRWPVKLTHQRNSQIGDRSRTDRVEFERR